MSLPKKSELRIAVDAYYDAFITVGLLSAVLNILLLGGSLYMMMVYDSVLPSRSLPTLFGLLAMIVIVYIFQGLLDFMRSRILADVGSALDRRLSARVYWVSSELARRGHRSGDGLLPMRDLDQIRGFLGGTGPATLIDFPWVVFFLGILFLIHFWLGVTALIGAIVMVGLTLLTDRAIKSPSREVGELSSARNAFAEGNIRLIETLHALGMRTRMQQRWEGANLRFMDAQTRITHAVALYGGTSKIFRQFLQSGILTVGAILVIDGKASGGVIFASSILSGRALAPIDQAIGNWRSFSAARASWARLSSVLQQVDGSGEPSLALPPPGQSLVVQNLMLTPPGSQRVLVQGVNFALEAGQALGIVGPSAAGKTSLGRGLVGIWRPVQGSVRLDGATYDQWTPDDLGKSLGYLAQTVELFAGTVGENIARFTADAPSQMILDAAREAGVHDLIVRLPNGYETQVGADGTELSAGQRQRIGLARALFGNPFLVVLDEPNSNLDAAGEAALSGAIQSIRARGGIAIVIAHRPAALAQVSHVMFMRDGRMEAFGPRDEILRKIQGTPAALRDVSKPDSESDGRAA